MQACPMRDTVRQRGMFTYFFIRRTKSPIARENVDGRENDVSGENDACRENDAVKENGIFRENDDTDVSKSGLMFFGSADGLKRAS